MTAALKQALEALKATTAALDLMGDQPDCYVAPLVWAMTDAEARITQARAAITDAEAELSREKPAQPIAWVVRVHGETPGRPLIHWTRSEADAHAAQFSDGLASVVELTDRAHHIPAAPAQETTR